MMSANTYTHYMCGTHNGDTTTHTYGDCRLWHTVYPLRSELTFPRARKEGFGRCGALWGAFCARVKTPATRNRGPMTGLGGYGCCRVAIAGPSARDSR